MNNDRSEQHKPQPQTAANPAGEPVGNPFENGQSADRDVQQASEELEKEQQFKEALTERD